MPIRAAMTSSRSRRCRRWRWCCRELIANAGLADRAATAGDPRDAGSARLTGQKLVLGMAEGHAVYHQPRVLIEHTVAEDIEAERHRVYSAFRKMREQIDAMTSAPEFGTAGEHHEVLETYKMFAYDEGWSRRINEAIDSGLTAEAAIERVRQRIAQRMRQIDDPLLADRMHDLDDLSNRLLRIVSGQLGTAAQMALPQRRDPDRPQSRARPSCSNMTGAS